MTDTGGGGGGGKGEGRGRGKILNERTSSEPPAPLLIAERTRRVPVRVRVWAPVRVRVRVWVRVWVRVRATVGFPLDNFVRLRIVALNPGG